MFAVTGVMLHSVLIYLGIIKWKGMKMDMVSSAVIKLVNDDHIWKESVILMLSSKERLKQFRMDSIQHISGETIGGTQEVVAGAV